MSYTVGMKTAISLPAPLFNRADKFARQRHLTRSALFQRAIEAYLNAHADITEQINSALDAIGEDVENETWVKATTAHAGRRRR